MSRSANERQEADRKAVRDAARILLRSFDSFDKKCWDKLTADEALWLKGVRCIISEIGK